MPLPRDASLDDVKVRIRESYTNPNVGRVQQAILKDGPRTFRIATLFEILDPKTSASHHYSLRIDSIDRRKAGWFAKPEKSIRLEGDDPNEIERLFRFLKAFMEGSLSEKSGDVHIVGSDDYARLERLLTALPNLASSDKLALVRTILSQLEGSPSVADEFVAAFQGGNADAVRHIGLAARMVEYERACSELRSLIAARDTLEPALQAHLRNHPWMFGSEYSELLDRRGWTRDSEQDYMLRRTVDSYLEVVEIKKPAETLFIHDRSHDTFHPSAKLSAALGQAIHYIEEIERDRNSIIAVDGEDPLKIRARVIIGRNGSAKERSALRNLNGHLHRIEVLTYDQLLGIAERTLAIFRSQAHTTDVEVENEPPF